MADFLERHPWSTAKEIDAECDTGCISKVLSDMPRKEQPGMGYGLSLDWRDQRCAKGRHVRKVRIYALLHRPMRSQQDLFEN